MILNRILVVIVVIRQPAMMPVACTMGIALEPQRDVDRGDVSSRHIYVNPVTSHVFAYRIKDNTLFSLGMLT
jgi:hypothetical protein